jgi:hypothetical protein
MEAPTNVEVWKNSSNGMRWYTKFDTMGRETSKTIGPSRTFTLTVLERQVNQEKAAMPEMDLFRDGTFVLVKAADETNRDEIDSVNALTDKDLGEIAYKVVDDPSYIDKVLKEIDSPIVINRLLEFLVAEDASVSAIDKTKAAYGEADDSVKATRRTVVTTTPAPQI